MGRGGGCGRCVTWSVVNLFQFLSVYALEQCYVFVVPRAELWISDPTLWLSCGGYFWVFVMITIRGRSFKSLQGFVGQRFSAAVHSSSRKSFLHYVLEVLMMYDADVSRCFIERRLGLCEGTDATVTVFHPLLDQYSQKAFSFNGFFIRPL